jgi:RHS repeat-associated protein
MLLYSAPNVRITRTNPGTGVVTKVHMLHLDGLGSVRAVTDEAGLARERTTFRPYGEEAAALKPLSLPETKGFIGERFDDTSGMLYLNARYYDPKLGLFLQPDWWEVTKPGVGTNRYGYAGDGPVNGRDPGGHSFGGSQHERPDSGPGQTTGGTSFSGGYDRHRDGAWGWKSGTYGYWKDYQFTSLKDIRAANRQSLSNPIAVAGVAFLRATSSIAFFMDSGAIVGGVKVRNWDYLSQNAALKGIVTSPFFGGLVVGLLDVANKSGLEAGGTLYYNSKTGEWRFSLEVGSSFEAGTNTKSIIQINVAPARKFETAATIHTHQDIFHTPTPSKGPGGDLDFRFPGLVIDRKFGVWGYYGGSY